MNRTATIVVWAFGAACAKDPKFVASDESPDTEFPESDAATEIPVVTETVDDVEDALDTVDSAETVDAADAVEIDVPPTCTCEPDDICEIALGCNRAGHCVVEALAANLTCVDPKLSSNAEACDFGRLGSATICGQSGQCSPAETEAPDSLALAGDWVAIITDTATSGGGPGHIMMGRMNVSATGTIAMSDVATSSGSGAFAQRFLSGAFCMGADFRVRVIDALGANTYRGFYAPAKDVVIFAGGSDGVLGFMFHTLDSAVEFSGRYRTITRDSGSLPARAWAGELEPKAVCSELLGFEKSDGMADRFWTGVACPSVVTGGYLRWRMAEVMDAELTPITWQGGMNDNGELAVLVRTDAAGALLPTFTVFMRKLPGLGGQELSGRWMGVLRTDTRSDAFTLELPFGATGELGHGVAWPDGKMNPFRSAWYLPGEEGGVSLSMGGGPDAALEFVNIVGAHAFAKDMMIAYRSRETSDGVAHDLDTTPSTVPWLMILVRDDR